LDAGAGGGVEVKRVRRYVYSIFEDGAGLLWLGGSGGVTSFDPRKEQITVHAHDP